ncbi:SpoIIE family protein phosphatase [Mitsuaria sp. WAJ17]|uniref:SpoIIE family protein phosphatase n=1 Tax=Mitsuaria sp. WAJ17 TaxID=2761452 RepID=UPI0016032318|nr:SpoIIE family protein phosphatase [Mitsuaria sp. WAJ17]MBB2487045.1 SpoIIE family protein phosphatase [Mitsuaria sp. WAJ17]
MDTSALSRPARGVPLRRWLSAVLPASLTGRVVLLFSATVILPLCLGLALFLHREFTTGIEDAMGTGQVLTEAVLPAINDSLVVGDYDTVRRSLDRLVRNTPYESAQFIDMDGGRLEVRAPSRPRGLLPPAFFVGWIQDRTGEVNIVCKVGGKDYGVLRLRFAAASLAQERWTLTLVSLGLGALTLLLATAVMRLSLRRWLEPLARLRAGALGAAVAGTPGAPIEISSAVDAFVQREQVLHRQRITAEATLAAVQDGVITLAVDGEVLNVNRAAAAMLGQPGALWCGRSVWQALPQLVRVGGGAPPTLAPCQWSAIVALPDGSGAARTLDLALGPISDAQGQVIGHVLSLRDVSEREAYEQRLHAELEMRRAAAEALHSTLRRLLQGRDMGEALALAPSDLEGVARLVADLVQQREEDQQALRFQKRAQDAHAAITIADADGRIIYANDKMLELTGFALHELLGERHHVLSSGVHPPAFFAELWQTIAAGLVWHGEIIDRSKSGERLWLDTTIVPALDADGRVQRYIAIRTDVSRLRRIEQALAEAQARELDTARLIQTSLLIGDVPAQLQSVAIACYNRASRGIDGDFYAITPLSEDCFELLVGDVMGKGVPAALVGAAVRTHYSRVVSELMAASLLHQAPRLPTPADILNALQAQLAPRLMELETFVTVALYRVDLRAGRIDFVNGGHTPLLLITPEGEVLRLLGDNAPLGVLPDEHYTQAQVELSPGATLLVYSDGITEAKSSAGAEFGEERLRELMAEAARLAVPADVSLQLLRRRLADFADPLALQDDETAVLVRLPGAEQSATRHVRLPWRREALTVLREALKAVGQDQGMPEEVLDRMVLASFEAAANIVRHAQAPFADACLHCEITPGRRQVEVSLWNVGDPFDPPDVLTPDFSGHSEGGFGLYIIRSLSSATHFHHPLADLNQTVLRFEW